MTEKQLLNLKYGDLIKLKYNSQIILILENKGLIKSSSLKGDYMLFSVFTNTKVSQYYFIRLYNKNKYKKINIKKL